ncbi:MAG: INTEGRAL MEMBRANE PROTEIN (Rhomboid family) [uncultured Frankineae bacterium]|uniref:UPF0182 protein AVDCRST_MAG07-2657 n=1 Tax=uncultured Frankineae bacterium TaxID=437475 RepID=A0A6J4LYZ6_9ACTN|nr:MAG: INTEGRAL MEMBRANE PROTEIN (Rhomboid family) [uncultured Frankineae bacterium]
MAVRTPGAGLPARPRLLGPVLVVLAVVLTLGGVVVSLLTDLLWFRSVDYTEVFTTVLTTRLLLFVGFGLLMAVLVGANVYIAYRVRPPFRPMSLEQQNLERYRVAVEPFLRTILLAGSGVFGLFAGLSAAARWETWLLWRNGTQFGVEDAQFGRDVSYFAFTYPFQRFVLGFLLTAVVLSLIAAAVVHYLFGGVRLQTVGEKVSPAARAHLSVLVGLIVLLKAFAYYLDRYGLAFSSRGYVNGPGFTDVNAVLPAKNILIGIALICSLLFFANIVVRNILLPAGALGLLVVSAVVIGGVYPAYTQQFRVNPNENRREQPFIQRNIEATRAAYGIDQTDVRNYQASQDATPEQLRAQASRVNSARLLDPNELAPTFEQLQRRTFYFGVNRSLDIDRYEVDGEPQDFIVAAREVQIGNLASNQRNWINERLAYTHGNGLIAAPADRVDEEGRPIFVDPDSPDSPVALEQPRIYFGELSPSYSIVNTDQPEIDGPIGGIDGGEAPEQPAEGEQEEGEGEAEGQATFNYDGEGGVRLSSIGHKLLYALNYREPNLLLSDAITDDSRLMNIREPRDRVEKVAPFLELDTDPYPAAVDGRIVWIVDGYTTSSGYPYSQRTNFGVATADSQGTGVALRQQVNYVRNSVKATVDAYDGTVTLYEFGDPDPVLRSWNKAFGGDLVQPESEISDELRAHLRYPEDLFKVQRELLTRYHVTDADEFFSREDFWEVPADPARALNDANAGAVSGPQAQPAQGQDVVDPIADGPSQPPFYSLLQFPGQDARSFRLSTSFNGLNRPNLAAFASVSSDPEDYGAIRVLKFPRQAPPNGPGQVANQFVSEQVVAESLFPFRQNRAEVTFGNLLTLPAGQGLLYVQPVYVRAQGGESFPTLQRVLVSYGNEVAANTSLARSLADLFGAAAPAEPTEEPGNEPTTPPTGTASPSPEPTDAPPAGDIPALVAEATAAFEAGQAALRANDFAAYGRAQERLRVALERLAAAEGAAPTG